MGRVTDYRELAQKLKPYIAPWIVAQGDSQAAASAVSGMAVHALNGAYHSGTLAQSQAPWAVTDDEFATHTSNPDAHHDTATAGNGIALTGQQVAVKLPTNSGLTADGTGLYLAPSTLTVASTNAVSGSGHTHGITASENPGAASSLLKSGTSGQLTLVNLFASQGVQYTTFTSGFAGAGWRADYGVTTASRASIETDDLTVRGRMRVYELLIQQIRATNGSVFVSSASKVLAVAATETNPLWTVNGSQLTLNGANATLTFSLYTLTTSTSGEDAASRRLYHGFLNGDIIRAQQVEWNGSAFGGVIQSNLEVTSVTNLYTYKAAFVSGDAPAIGYDYVRLGNALDSTRRGSVYITADDSAAPFIDIVDEVAAHSDWNTTGKIKARLGKLSGISDSDFGGALSGYGLYSNNVYLRGQIIVTGGDLGGLAAADVNANTTTIDGGRITANSVTASQIQANTITASQIATGTITASQLSATAIDSMTITGATLRTAASGARVAIDVSGLRAYNSSNTVLVAIDSGTGALTATSATISGAITATSGSIDGFLTLGSSGGIYQGTGTSGSPTTGLKIWNDSGIGRIAGYNGGNLQWFGSTTGYLYAGRNDANSTSYGADRWGLRLARDGMRLIAEANTSFDQKASTSAIRWIFNSTHDIDATLDTSTSFVSLYAYNNTSSNIVYSGLTTFVGSGAYTSKDATVYLSAQHYTGSVYHGVDFTLTTVKSTGATYAYCNADEFQLTKALKFDEMTAPAAPAANGVYIYAEDNGAGKTRLMAKFASGAAQQIAIQP